ncbi:MAG: glycosyltransferase [Kiritimatiellae bacterium]|nr:glycosyltransferase [Kiritimatiellia bacterium]
MASKILSVIVPSYNMEAYLPKCLGSLVIDDQELLEKLDVIVVNDGSKDRTSEITHGFEREHPRVFRVIDKGNGHYGSCINAALPVACGEYVKVLDADDCVDTQGFKRLLEVLCEELGRNDGAADLVATDYVSVNPNGDMLTRSNFGFGEGATTLDEQGKDGTRLTIHAICYRTENLRRIGYRQSEGVPYTDTEWIIEPMTTVRRLRFIPVVVNRYLVGRDGQTVDIKEVSKNFQVILDITMMLVERYGTNSSACEATAIGYYRNQIIFMLRLSYFCGLFGRDGVRMNGNLKLFDEHLSLFPFFYHAAEGFSCGPNRFPFKYVAFYRKHGNGTIWHLRKKLNDLNSWLAKVIHHFRGRRRRFDP